MLRLLCHLCAVYSARISYTGWGHVSRQRAGEAGRRRSNVHLQKSHFFSKRRSSNCFIRDRCSPTEKVFSGNDDGQGEALMIGPRAERLHKSNVKVTAAQHEAALKKGPKEIKHIIKDNAKPGRTVGGDKNYDTAEFVAGCRRRGCTPHVSQNNTNRRSRSMAARPATPAIASARSSGSASRNRDQDRRRSAQDTPLQTGGRVRARKHESPVPCETGPSLDGSGFATRFLLRMNMLR
jgi:hypothetical protein